MQKRTRPNGEGPQEPPVFADFRINGEGPQGPPAFADFRIVAVGGGGGWEVGKGTPLPPERPPYRPSPSK